MDIGEDLIVIGPGGGGKVDSLRRGTWIEAGEEEGAQVDGTSARDGLEGNHLRIARSISLMAGGVERTTTVTNPFVLDDRASRANNELLSGRSEVREASDGKIFMVEVRVSPEDLIGLQRKLSDDLGEVDKSIAYFLDDWQHPRFRIVVSVGTNA